MIGGDLVGIGFGPWQPFCLADEQQLLAALPSGHGSYVICNSFPFGRLVGASDIVYIGSSKNAEGLRNRLYQYFHAGSSQVTNKRMHALMIQAERLSVAWKVCDSCEEARCLERHLLQQYYEDHWELPPLNHQMPGKPHKK